MEKFEERMEQSKFGKYAPEEYLRFHEELLQIRNRNKKLLANYDVYPNLSVNEVTRLLIAGLPLIDSKRLNLKPEVFCGFFKEICSFLMEYYEGKKSVAKLIDLEESKNINFVCFIKMFLSNDLKYFEGISKKFKIDLELLLFIAKNLAIPPLELCAEKFGPSLKPDMWIKNFCPICGNKPGMAKLEKENGKRVLQCSMCNTPWVFRRLECPFCGNTDHKTLKFFYVEDADFYRVDVCDRCRGYLKTLDERKLSSEKEITLAIEDINTIYLDILAEKEGYIKSSGKELDGIVF